MIKIKSHIQMPKCVLKQFENEKKVLFYYDINNYVKNSLPKECHAASLNTELNYYSENVEKVLNIKVENGLGKVLSFIRKEDFNSGKIEIPSEYETIIKRYLYSIVSRSTQVLSEVKEKSIIFEKLNIQEQHDIVVLKGIHSKVYDNILNNYHLTFMTNKTEHPFILTLYGLCTVLYNDYKMIIMPLSPEIAAVLTEEKWFEENSNDNSTTIINDFNEDDIKEIISIMLDYEFSQGRGICVSNDRKYLEKTILNYMKLNNYQEN